MESMPFLDEFQAPEAEDGEYEVSTSITSTEISFWFEEREDELESSKEDIVKKNGVPEQR